ncbi:MAG: hypothetical protein ACERKD_20480 [Prolixibacteraceae bacterium]
MFKIGWIFILLLLLNACELVTEIDYAESTSTPYIVINGFMSYENGINVLLSHSVSVNHQGDNDVVENPNVCLCENGQAIKQLIKTDAYHYELSKDSVSFNIGASYSIKVEAKGYETASTRLQEFVAKVLIDTAYIDKDSSYLYYAFHDDPNIGNYYSAKIKYYANGSTSNYDSTQIVPNYVGSDDNYNGKVLRYTELPYSVFDSVKIYLYSVSKDYADFMGSYFDYELSYADYNYETVYPVESQVEYGFGFFVSYEVSQYVLKIN